MNRIKDGNKTNDTDEQKNADLRNREDRDVGQSPRKKLPPVTYDDLSDIYEGG